MYHKYHSGFYCCNLAGGSLLYFSHCAKESPGQRLQQITSSNPRRSLLKWTCDELYGTVRSRDVDWVCQVAPVSSKLITPLNKILVFTLAGRLMVARPQQPAVKAQQTQQKVQKVTANKDTTNSYNLSENWRVSWQTSLAMIKTLCSTGSVSEEDLGSIRTDSLKPDTKWLWPNLFYISDKTESLEDEAFSTVAFISDTNVQCVLPPGAGLHLILGDHP